MKFVALFLLVVAGFETFNSYKPGALNESARLVLGLSIIDLRLKS